MNYQRNPNQFALPVMNNPHVTQGFPDHINFTKFKKSQDQQTLIYPQISQEQALVQKQDYLTLKSAPNNYLQALPQAQIYQNVYQQAQHAQIRTSGLIEGQTFVNYQQQQQPLVRNSYVVGEVPSYRNFVKTSYVQSEVPIYNPQVQRRSIVVQQVPQFQTYRNSIVVGQTVVRSDMASEELRIELQAKIEECTYWKQQFEILDQKYRGMDENQRRLLLEVQFKENQFDQKTFELTQELQRVNSILRQKVEEIDKLRVFQRKCLDYENELKSIGNEMDVLRNEIERINIQKKEKITLIEEYKKKVMTLEISQKDLNIQMQRLNDEISFKNKEIQEYKLKVQRLDIFVLSLKEKEQLLYDYESKIALLTQEIERLNSMVKKRGEESGLLKSSMSGLEVELYQYKQNYSDCQIKITKLESQLKEQRIRDQNLIELENKCAMLSQEIERLNMMVRKKQGELEDNLRKSTSFQLTIEERESEFYRVKSEYENIQFKYTNMQAEVQNKNKIIYELESSISYLKQDYEQTSSNLKSRLLEIEQLKYKLSQQETSSSQSILYEKKITQLKQENEFLSTRVYDIQKKLEYSLGYAVLIATQIDSLSIQGERQSKEIFESKQELRKSVNRSQELVYSGHSSPIKSTYIQKVITTSKLGN